MNCINVPKKWKLLSEIKSPINSWTILCLIKQNKYTWLFGILNEIEYSTNFNINIPLCFETNWIERIILYQNFKLYFDDKQISSTIFPNANTKYFKLFVRLDYIGTHLQNITAKLVILIHNEEELKAKASIEIPLDVIIKNKPTYYFKKRFFTHWFLSFMMNDIFLVFRVAPRKNETSSIHTEFNIECENTSITCEMFREIKTVIELYYLSQVEIMKYIQPICNDKQFIFNLKYVMNTLQQQLFSTMCLIRNEDVNENDEDIGFEMKRFIESLSLELLKLNNCDLTT